MKHPQAIVEMNAELAAEALDGIAFQAAAAARFLRRGDDLAAIETYRRIVAIAKEYASPSMKLIAEWVPDALTAEAAREWRAARDARCKQTKSAA